MKKVFIVLILFPILGFSQFASSSYVTLNDGMEDAYLQLEKLWSEYHKEAVKKGHKNSWSIWKVDPTGYEDKIEKSRVPHFMIIETFDTKEQMDEEFARYDEKGLAEIRALIKKKLKGKMSSSKIDKISFPTNPVAPTIASVISFTVISSLFFAQFYQKELKSKRGS